MPEEQQPLLLTEEVRALLELIKHSDIAEVLIEHGDARLHVKRSLASAPASMPGAIPAAPLVVSSAAPVAMPEVIEPLGIAVPSPMVGTFYRASAPNDPPYVQPGDEVRPGDVIGIVEAMKIMNEIECEVQGRVAQVLVENGQPVEYGQTLLLIEPL